MRTAKQIQDYTTEWVKKNTETYIVRYNTSRLDNALVIARLNEMRRKKKLSQYIKLLVEQDIENQNQ